LLCRTKPSKDEEIILGLGGCSASLIELNFNSDVVWRYDDPMLHHDYVRLSNGNTVVLLFRPLPEDAIVSVKGGYITEEDPSQMLGDIIREVSPAGTTLREWDISEALVTDEDIICPLEHRREWTHANSLNLTPSGDFLVSFRNTSTVGIIDRESSAYVWKWGPGHISHQHHATFLDNGNVLLFDNGSHSKGVERSRVIEVDPKSNQIKWEFTETPPVFFYSSHIGGAERQPNGNTLVCEGAFGRIFEITSDGEVVWEFVNPFHYPDERTGELTNMAFRAHKYGLESPVLRGMELDYNQYGDINAWYGASNKKFGL